MKEWKVTIVERRTSKVIHVVDVSIGPLDLAAEAWRASIEDGKVDKAALMADCEFLVEEVEPPIAPRNWE